MVIILSNSGNPLKETHQTLIIDNDVVYQQDPGSALARKSGKHQS